MLLVVHPTLVTHWAVMQGQCPVSHVHILGCTCARACITPSVTAGPLPAGGRPRHDCIHQEGAGSKGPCCGLPG